MGDISVLTLKNPTRFYFPPVGSWGPEWEPEFYEVARCIPDSCRAVILEAPDTEFSVEMFDVARHLLVHKEEVKFVLVFRTGSMVILEVSRASEKKHPVREHYLTGTTDEWRSAIDLARELLGILELTVAS